MRINLSAILERLRLVPRVTNKDALVREMLSMLIRLEWGSGLFCEICENQAMTDCGKHKKGCALAELIEKAKGSDNA